MTRLVRTTTGVSVEKLQLNRDRQVALTGNRYMHSVVGPLVDRVVPSRSAGT